MKIFQRIFLPIMLMVGVALTALPILAEVTDGNPLGLQRAMEVQERNTDALLTMPGVVGTAVGLRGDGAPVVLVLTEHGLVRGLPQSLEGVPVQVKVTGKIYSRHHTPGHDGGPPGGGGGGGSGEEVDPTARFDRPVPIGVSTGHPDITAGTIGTRVTEGGNVYALSNNHVYADENFANIGDDVIQPGSYDDGKLPADYLGALSDYKPIVFSTSAENDIDAAIAITTTDLLGNATPSDGYGTPKTDTISSASLNMKVKKYGRTTGQTKGQVYAINATVDVGYTSGVARFINQIIITPGSFSAGGDSGSLIVVDGKGRNKADDRRPVGLLFAGSNVVTIANPIDAVLGYFGVAIDGN